MQKHVLAISDVEIVDLQEVKEACRVTHNEQNSFLQNLTRSAISLCETVGRVSVFKQTLLAVYPMPYLRRTSFGLPATVVDNDNIRGGFRLPYGPVRSVTSVKITGTEEDKVLTEGTDYKYSESREHIVFVEPLQLTEDYAGVLEVTYDTGFDAVGETPAVRPLPHGIKRGVIDTTAMLYDEPESTKLPVSARIALKSYWRPIQ